MPAALDTPIHAAQLALLALPIAMHLGSCDARRRPHVAIGLGHRLSPDRRTITVFLSSRSGAQVLDDVRANARIAVVFCDPVTNVTLQLKGEDARVVDWDRADDALVERHMARFVAAVEPEGYPPPLIRSMFHHAPDERIAVRFAPCETYDQTPGPRAGVAWAEDASS